MLDSTCYLCVEKLHSMITQLSLREKSCHAVWAFPEQLFPWFLTLPCLFTITVVPTVTLTASTHTMSAVQGAAALASAVNTPIATTVPSIPVGEYCIQQNQSHYPTLLLRISYSFFVLLFSLWHRNIHIYISRGF